MLLVPAACPTRCLLGAEGAALAGAAAAPAQNDGKEDKVSVMQRTLASRGWQFSGKLNAVVEALDSAKKACVCLAPHENCGKWNREQKSVADLAEWDRWQPLPKIALLEVEHMVNCINFNNCFLCFDKNWQRPKGSSTQDN